MPEAISTPNFVALPVTNQKLGKGSILAPNQNRTIAQQLGTPEFDNPALKWVPGLMWIPGLGWNPGSKFFKDLKSDYQKVKKLCY